MEIMPNINTNTNMLQDNITKLSENKNLDKTLKEDKRLKEVCQDFEAIFIHMMLKSGRDTVSEGGLVEKSNATKMFEDMHDQEMSTLMSKSEDGGMGVAKMLYEQMKLGLNTQKPQIEQIEPEELENLGVEESIVE